MALCRAVLLLVLTELGDVSAFRHRRAGGDVAPKDDSSATCGAPGFIFNGVRSAVNKFVTKQLPDPIDMQIVEADKQINLWLCNLGINMNSSITITGLKDAILSKLECSSSRCISQSFFGCSNTEYNLTAEVSFGDILSASGYDQAEWELCGLTVHNRSIEVGFDLLAPSVKTSILVEYNTMSAKIIGIDSLEINFGEANNFKCGFELLPDFIGSKLEKWCETILQWLVVQAQQNIFGDLDELLKGLVNSVLNPESEESAPVAEPQA